MSRFRNRGHGKDQDKAPALIRHWRCKHGLLFASATTSWAEHDSSEDAAAGLLRLSRNDVRKAAPEYWLSLPPFSPCIGRRAVCERVANGAVLFVVSGRRAICERVADGAALSAVLARGAVNAYWARRARDGRMSEFRMFIM